MATVEPTEHQRREIDRVCDFIVWHSRDLTQIAGDSRWTEGNVLFRYESDEPGMYAYMVGPLKDGRISLHLMPLYALPELREQHAEAFKPFSAGKSCIHFDSFDDLPQEALKDVIERGTPQFKAAMEAQLDKKGSRRNKENPPKALL